MSTCVFYYFYYVEQPYPPLPLKFLTVRRNHVQQASLQKAFKNAVEKAGITENAAVHTYSKTQLRSVFTVCGTNKRSKW